MRQNTTPIENEEEGESNGYDDDLKSRDENLNEEERNE
jgi:hypothetical protein